MILNFDDKIMIIFTCQNMKISIAFHQKTFFINQTIKALSQMMISNDKIISISIRIKEAKISKNKNYNFYFKTNILFI